MSRERYRYQFDDEVPVRDIEETLILALLAVESMHGRTRVRMDARFQLDKKNRACVIDADTQIGADLAKIFTGYVTREFGDDAGDRDSLDGDGLETDTLGKHVDDVGADSAGAAVGGPEIQGGARPPLPRRKWWDSLRATRARPRLGQGRHGPDIPLGHPPHWMVRLASNRNMAPRIVRP